MKYYNTLNINRNANEKEIKKAYRKLALKYHPDKYKGSDIYFKNISEAYTILSDEKLRRQYDTCLNNKITPYNLFQNILSKYKMNDFINIINNLYDN